MKTQLSVTPNFINDPEQVKEAYNILKQMPEMGFDIETNGLDPFVNQVLTLQFGNNKLQFIFHVGSLGESIKPVLSLLSDPSIIKIGHNLKFDYKFMKHRFGVNFENIRDTYVIDHLLTKGQGNDFEKRYSLDKAVANYLEGVDMEKTTRLEFTKMNQASKLTSEQIYYCALDVAVLVPLWDALKHIVINYNLQETAAMECKCVLATGDMELNGITLDKKEWAKLEKDAQDKIRVVDTEILTAFAPYALEVDLNKSQGSLFETEKVINLDSPTQIRPILERIVGETLPDTEEKTLIKYKDKFPIMQAFLKHRELAKRISTYGLNFFELIHDYDGRIHPQFDQIRPDTGRYSSKGPNFQNIPTQAEETDPDYKKAFVAAKGHKLICADYSGCELRILAELSGDPTWIEAFHKGLDMHCFVAAMINNMKYEDMVIDVNIYPHKVKKELKGFRNKAKILNFGIPYGKDEYNLSLDLKISVDEARALLDSFWNSFPMIREFLDGRADFAQKNNYALSLMDNRRRWFTGDPQTWVVRKKKKHARNVAYNFCCQAGNASITKRALVYLRQAFIEHPEWNAKLLGTVHDEIVVECFTEYAEECKQRVEYEMLRAEKFYLKAVPSALDIHVGDYWIH